MKQKKSTKYLKPVLTGLLIIACIVIAINLPFVTRQEPPQVLGPNTYRVDLERQRLANDPVAQLKRANYYLDNAQRELEGVKKELAQTQGQLYRSETYQYAYQAALVFASKSFKQSPAEVAQSQPFWMKLGDRTSIHSTSCMASDVLWTIEVVSIDDKQVEMKINGQLQEFFLNPDKGYLNPYESQFRLVHIQNGKALIIVSGLDAC